MTSQQLADACQPLTPEEALQALRDLYDDLANSPGWVTDEELEALNAAIQVLSLAIEETGKEG